MMAAARPVIASAIAADTTHPAHPARGDGARGRRDAGRRRGTMA
eukprot:gene375-2641_t